MDAKGTPEKTETTRLSEGEFKRGAQVISQPMDPSYEPPSASLSPQSSTGSGDGEGDGAQSSGDGAGSDGPTE
jgi:hypothetical protein